MWRQPEATGSKQRLVRQAVHHVLAPGGAAVPGTNFVFAGTFARLAGTWRERRSGRIWGSA